MGGGATKREGVGASEVLPNQKGIWTIVLVPKTFGTWTIGTPTHGRLVPGLLVPNTWAIVLNRHE